MVSISELYETTTETEKQKDRYALMEKVHRERFKEATPVRFFSSPGRSEIGGNHTDHNNGKVIAAGINLDCAAAAAPSDKIYIIDLTYNKEIELRLDACFSPDNPPSKSRSALLVMGLLSAFREFGWQVGGFNAVVTNSIPSGSGVSSSAAFEMLLGFILSSLYNNGSIPAEKLALAGRYAENVFWKKASGLLDQIACGTGGLIAVDFENPSLPKIEKIDFDFARRDISLLLVNSGGSHSSLTEEYSSIPREMKEAAGIFGLETLRGISSGDLAGRAAEIRRISGDRALLRAIHFAGENRRVEAQIEALKKDDMPAFLALVNESGNSSWKYLQNVYVASISATEQNTSVCLALTEVFFRNEGLEGKAACRIHGGGFAGVIQVFIPQSYASRYTQWITGVLGARSPAAAGHLAGEEIVFNLTIRQYGVVEVDL